MLTENVSMLTESVSMLTENVSLLTERPPMLTKNVHLDLLQWKYRGSIVARGGFQEVALPQDRPPLRRVCPSIRLVPRVCPTIRQRFIGSVHLFVESVHLFA